MAKKLKLTEKKQKWVGNREVALKGDPLPSNSGLEIKYRKKLNRLVDAMHKEVDRELTSLFKGDAAKGFAQDASISSAVRVLMNKLSRKYDRVFAEHAKGYAEYLARIGYAPQNMIDVVSVLKSQEEFDKYQARREGRQPQAYHGVFASHPRNDTRLQKIIAAAGKYKKGATRDAGHDRYLRMIAGLKFRINKNNYGRVVVGTSKNSNLTYASLAQKSRVDEQRLRLLNGMFPKGQPIPGRLVKIIQ